MGKKIVYCVGCGNSLRDNDFSEGQAIVANNRPYCGKCRPKNLPTETPPEAEPAPTAPPRKTSTARIHTQRPSTARKKATDRLSQGHQTDRRRPVPARTTYRNWPLIIGGIVLGVALILLILTVLLRRELPTQPPGEPSAPTQKP